MGCASSTASESLAAEAQREAGQNVTLAPTAAERLRREAKKRSEATRAQATQGKEVSANKARPPTVKPSDDVIEDESTAQRRVAVRSSEREVEAQQAQVLVSHRAAGFNLPERLTLGLSVDAIEEYITALPADAVEQCNENRPTINGVRVPANGALNGYVNQWLVARFSEANGGKAYCETLYERGDPGVGVATVFVSWFLETPLATLVDALRQYLRLHPELPPDTKFWVCDFVIRQSTRSLAVTMNDVKRLGDCVRAVGHTVLLMEPWGDPKPLRRAYCIKEVFHTQASGARFEVVMSAEQQAAFETALVEDFHSIAKKLSEVDVRKAECRNPKDTEQILGELEREVGLTECNKAVFGLLRGALAGQGRAALERMEPAERATSTLINNLGILLKEQGDMDGAEALFREALEGRRETLGDWQLNMLSSIGNLGTLLYAKGDLDGAEALHREALEGFREALGDWHPGTLASINNLGSLLQKKGNLDGAEALVREALEAQRETLGDRHPSTLASINNLGSLLKAKGDLNGAEALHREALEGFRETLGDRHPDTLGSISNLGVLLKEKGHLDGAEALVREVLEAQRETLGDRHPSTLISINNLGELLKAKGDLNGAEALYREALEGKREALGDRHPSTLASINNLGLLLYVKGDLDGAEALYREALEAQREALGGRHQNTLASISGLGLLLQDKGDLDGAEALYREALEGRRETLGDRHPDTLFSINNLGMLLQKKGDGMGGMGGMPGMMRQQQQQLQQPERFDAMKAGTRVTIQGLQNAAHLNGETGAVRRYEASKGRYVVDLEEQSEQVSLKPDNMQQMVPGVVLRAIDSDDSLNGQSGTLLRFDAAKDRYTVRLNAMPHSLSLRPENVVLPNGTCVTIRGLQAKPQLNGQRGTVTAFDRQAGRYVIQTSPSESAKLKPGNVVA